MPYYAKPAKASKNMKKDNACVIFSDGKEPIANTF